MVGIGPQEVVVIVLLLLVVFGPGKAVNIARDLGRFANEARRPVEEFKSELSTPVQEFRDGARYYSDKELRAEVATSKDGNEPTVDPFSNDEDGEHRPKDGRELSHKEETPPLEVPSPLE